VSDVPESWPPEEELRVLPLFPRPRVWLFPYMVLPLHVFEPRYRALVDDSLDGPGRIVLGTIALGHEEEAAGSPPLEPLAGLGEIGRHEKLPKGRYMIWVVGLKRVRVREVESEHPYRLVEVHPAEEIPVPPDEEVALRRELMEAILSRTPEKLSQPVQMPPKIPLSHLADLLALRMPLPSDVVAQLYGELDVGARIRATLAEHAVRPELEEPDEDSEEPDDADD
jgi:Lon protease-like protein